MENVFCHIVGLNNKIKDKIIDILLIINILYLESCYFYEKKNLVYFKIL